MSDWTLMFNPYKALAVFGLLLISAFAASSETAFFSLNRFQLRRIKERYRHAYDRIRTLMSRPSRLLIMVLILCELVNLMISSFVTEFLEKNLKHHAGLGEDWLLLTMLSMAITVPVVLIFGEITPKLIATKMNRIVAIVNSRVLIVVYRLFYPVLWVMDAAIGLMLRKLKAEGRDHLAKTMSILGEEDIVALMEEGHREGTVDPSERKLIKNVFEFDDSTVAEVMTPITQAFSISASARIVDVLPELKSQKYSRVPVYHKNRRNIVGVLYMKDLLALRNHPGLRDLEVRSVMTNAMFVSSNMRLSLLFRRLKEAKTHMAIVLSPMSRQRLEDGDREEEEAIGVVTMEDVLESIFGEIADERDVQ